MKKLSAIDTTPTGKNFSNGVSLYISTTLQVRPYDWEKRLTKNELNNNFENILFQFAFFFV